MSKREVEKRIWALEHGSGEDDPIIGTVEYDQLAMRFKYKDKAYDVDGLVKLFHENPRLFVWALPTDESYKHGYCYWVWVAGERFKGHAASVQDFIEYLQTPPEPIDVLRGRLARNEQ